MIEPSQIQELLDHTSFESFVIRMTDGQQYDVVNPSLGVTMQGAMFPATPARDRFKLPSYRNMTSIESQTQADSVRRGSDQRWNGRPAVRPAARSVRY